MSSSADSRRASYQLLANEWALNTGKLPLGGLPRNSGSVTDHHNMTSAVSSGRKALNQSNLSLYCLFQVL